MSDAKKVVSGIGGLRASLEAIGGCDCRTWDDLLKENKALLAEVARLKARLTITDELLKTAARAAREAAGVNSKTMRNLREHYLDSWMTVTRAALLAAGMEAQP